MDSKGSSKSASRPPRPLQSSSPKTQYLILYNFVSAILWTTVLGRVLILIPLVGFGGVYGGVGQFTKWTQTLALMEILHSIFGVVRSPIFTTVMQVSSRILLVWGIVNVFPSLAGSPGYSSMLIAWSVTEVIRYSYFTLTLSGYSPGILSWLRYNTFFVLYPLGVSSECWLVFSAIAPGKEWRQEFSWALQLILLIYVPGSYILYTHMMAQRRKIIRGKKAAKVN